MVKIKNGAINNSNRERLRQFLKSSLEVQKQAIDKEWRQKISNIFETEGDIDFIKNQLLK